MCVNMARMLGRTYTRVVIDILDYTASPCIFMEVPLYVHFHVTRSNRKLALRESINMLLYIDIEAYT